MIKIKINKLCVKWKWYDNSFKSWIDKKRHCIKMIQYFTKPYEPFWGDIDFQVATKADLENATGTDTSKLAAKFDLISKKLKLIK